MAYELESALFGGECLDDAGLREDMLRVVASIYTGTVRAYDMVALLQRDGHPICARRGHRDVRAPSGICATTTTATAMTSDAALVRPTRSPRWPA
jgi:hypothetical protein